MNRSYYFNFIEEKLNLLVVRVQSRGKLNILDFHLHSESFYQHFFNCLFNWELENQNTIRHNVPGLDLIDRKRKILIQVSATATKQKINSALSKDLSAYSSHSFKFIAIHSDASALRTQTYDNPHVLSFSPNDDIYDVVQVLKHVQACSVDDQRRLFELLKKELGSGLDLPRVESHLASIIKILDQEDWEQASELPKTDPYEVIRKIDHNALDDAKSIIDDFALYGARLDRIYEEFNKQGRNKSKLIWNLIRHDYMQLAQTSNGDALFTQVINAVIERIRSSANYSDMAIEELVHCSSILVVDAFMRCKIFKEPPKVAANVIA